MDERQRRRARTRLRLLAAARSEEQGPATRAHGNEPPPSHPAVSFDPQRLTDGELAEIARSSPLPGLRGGAAALQEAHALPAKQAANDTRAAWGMLWRELRPAVGEFLRQHGTYNDAHVRTVESTPETRAVEFRAVDFDFDDISDKRERERIGEMADLVARRLEDAWRAMVERFRRKNGHLPFPRDVEVRYIEKGWFVAAFGWA